MKTTLYIATSLDGKITGENDDTSWIEEKDVERFDNHMEKCGVMLMGRKTYESLGDDLPADKALQIVFTNNPELLKTKRKNVRFTSESPEKVLDDLESEGFKEALLAGGAELNTSFLKADLIDEIRLIIKPIICGKGKPLFNEIDLPKKFKVEKVEKLDYGSLEVIYIARKKDGK